ncbi:hypothetical protein [Turneriella parva]|uniref:Peptidylprolyl isomerase n=1 Tax=Turneriella parva (strain ATCC BAA-1111 / DSM 21527 / NCTC 11395 / H) TaxID=869212 RepID=I4BBG0_TURPD|nr:hypothetical protein [Turneriella parva]AFM14617.1 hypothetical protein Turpa_3983 [Turneriella parva DSM 21527]
MKKIRITAVAGILALIALACGSDKSQWLWKIEGKSVSMKQLDEAYSGFGVLMKEQLQQRMGRFIPEEEFKQLLEDPDRSGNPQLAEMFKSFGKDLFSEQYKDMLILNMEAQKDGYARRPEVKAKLEFLQKYFLANMYLFDLLKLQEIKISDAEAYAAWEKAKREDARLKTIPVDQGLEMIKGRMVMASAMEKQRTLLKNATQKYRIETNKDFDIATYVKEQREEARKKREAAAAAPAPAPEEPKK